MSVENTNVDAATSERVPMPERGEDRTERRGWPWIIAILVLSTGLRLWAIPPRYAFDDVDEFYYLMGGPQVWEGLAPPYHYGFAGPETWVGWTYVAGITSKYLLFPTAEEAAAPVPVRPFVATDHAMWDTYYDMTALRLFYVYLQTLISIVSVLAAYGYGRRRGGFAGGVLLASLAAFLPVLVAHSAVAKPYSMAWSCVLLAACLLAQSHERAKRFRWSAVFFGLAIASRVEMIGVLPILALLEIWPNRQSLRGFVGSLVRYAGIAVVTLMVVAPWSWTNLLGNLRAIATIRLGPPPVALTTSGILVDLAWVNAFGLPIILLMVASGLAIIRRKAASSAGWTWPAVILGLAFLPTFLAGTGYGLRHQGPAFISVLLLMPKAIAVFASVASKALNWGTVFAIALLALYQSTIQVRAASAATINDGSTQWVNANVAPGTLVYLTPTWNDPLPTPQSADALWDEVMSRDAVVRKFNASTTRFSLPPSQTPRALSEQIMMTERSSARRFYILGGRSDRAGPRFNVRRYLSSGVFGIQDPVPEFLKTGGVLVWRGNGPPPGLSLQPVASWISQAGNGTFIYTLPEAKLPLGKQ